ncbi:DUF2390 domain-containing protein [Thioalkalivibrio sp.]|uniref:DUF2390 domain-containing protein n=1 Tax=Thioalkalivibrio sp. TaxID=2093813 RepID=UPI0035695323
MSPSRRPPDPEAFWAFAVAAWDRADVRDLLLHWQERHGVDVIFLLFACWLPHALAPAHWTALESGSTDWNAAVTRRVRALRRRVRAIDWPQGYRAILGMELASERIEATWLARAASPPERAPRDPDLDQRLGRLFGQLPPAERTAFIAAIRALFY